MEHFHPFSSAPESPQYINEIHIYLRITDRFVKSRVSVKSLKSVSTNNSVITVTTTLTIEISMLTVDTINAKMQYCLLDIKLNKAMASIRTVKDKEFLQFFSELN